MGWIHLGDKDKSLINVIYEALEERGDEAALSSFEALLATQQDIVPFCQDTDAHEEENQAKRLALAEAITVYHRTVHRVGKLGVNTRSHIEVQNLLFKILEEGLTDHRIPNAFPGVEEKE